MCGTVPSNVNATSLDGNAPTDASGLLAGGSCPTPGVPMHGSSSSINSPQVSLKFTFGLIHAYGWLKQAACSTYTEWIVLMTLSAELVWKTLLSCWLQTERAAPSAGASMLSWTEMPGVYSLQRYGRAVTWLICCASVQTPASTCRRPRLWARALAPYCALRSLSPWEDCCCGGGASGARTTAAWGQLRMSWWVSSSHTLI